MPTILVVDDNAELCGLVCTALETKGARVIASGNIAEGLQLARTHLPDLIISDVIMDNGDGYQLMTALRHDPPTSGIPCILMTGAPSRPGLHLGMQLGAEDYLSKPFTLQQLFSAVEASLRKRQSLAQA